MKHRLLLIDLKELDESDNKKYNPNYHIKEIENCPKSHQGDINLFTELSPIEDWFEFKYHTHKYLKEIFKHVSDWIADTSKSHESDSESLDSLLIFHTEFA